MTVYERLRNQIDSHKPFVVYSKPESKKVIGIFQKTSQLHVVKSYKEKGFVFVPFHEGIQVLFPQEHVDVVVEDWLPDKRELSDPVLNYKDPVSRDAFEKLVEKGIDAIRNKRFEKVVLSRKEKVSNGGVCVDELFKNLKSTYPTAFCSVFYHPQIGMWAGATPEQLLKINQRELFTMALAGTQVNHEEDEVYWGQKEREEQQYVTDFIVDSLTLYTDLVEKGKTFTARAAKVMHIRTDIRALLKETVDLKKVIHALHPTPAVCGMPKDVARDFILKEEGYDRKYYSGFLGELNVDFETKEGARTDLYVNLRCMEVESEKASVYVGCGVTIDSDPECEFIETINKSATMKKVIV